MEKISERVLDDMGNYQPINAAKEKENPDKRKVLILEEKVRRYESVITAEKSTHLVLKEDLNRCKGTLQQLEKEFKQYREEFPKNKPKKK